MRLRRRTPPPLMEHSGCARHPTDLSVGLCDRCGSGCCEHCYVEAGKHAYCVPCALTMAGVSTRQ
jgi:hypothetical protein